jgi:hypothetical protein
VADVVSKYQRLFDHDFPQGALCQWVEPDPVQPMRVARIQVTGAAGDDPVVALPVFAVDKVIGPSQLLSYTVTQRAPCVVARVQLEGIERPMLWSSGIGPLLAHAMAPERAQLKKEVIPDAGTGLP